MNRRVTGLAARHEGTGSEIAFPDAILPVCRFPKVHFVYGWSAQGRI